MTPWAHLPNAALIDEVLASVKADPNKWSAAWDVTQGTARSAAWNAAWDVAWSAARSAAWDAARDVLGVLVAYDDAGQFMKLPVEHLRRLHRIDPHPMFLLLQPAAIVFAEQGDSVCPG